jgi:hypothetical protein
MLHSPLSVSLCSILDSSLSVWSLFSIILHSLLSVWYLFYTTLRLISILHSTLSTLPLHSPWSLLSIIHPLHSPSDLYSPLHAPFNVYSPPSSLQSPSDLYSPLSRLISILHYPVSTLRLISILPSPLSVWSLFSILPPWVLLTHYNTRSCAVGLLIIEIYFEKMRCMKIERMQAEQQRELSTHNLRQYHYKGDKSRQFNSEFPHVNHKEETGLQKSA